MPNGTYSAYYDTPLYLTPAYTTVTVTSAGTIDVPSGNGITGGTLDAYTVLTLGTIIAAGEVDDGVFLLAGGSVTNGATGSTEALIEGGVRIDGAAAGTLANFGTIESTIGEAVMVEDNSFITNGAAGSTGALIESRYFGIVTGPAAATIDNFGTIEGMSDWGVALNGGGGIANAGLISGGIHTNGLNHSAASTITNAGTIDGSIGDYYGTLIVINGAGDLIESGTQQGIAADGITTVTNFGAIESLGTSLRYNDYPGGIYLAAHGIVINGSTEDSAALISGYAYGIRFASGGTVTNFGTISSGGRAGAKGGDGLAAGFAVEFASSASAADRLIDNVGSRLIGKVRGGGGNSVLEFSSGGGAGTVTGLGTRFTRFGTIAVDSGAQWDVTGANTVAESTVLDDSGTLWVESGAVLDIAKGARLSGAGTIDVTGGKLELGVSVASAHLGFTGAGMIVLTQHGTYAGIIIADIGPDDRIKLDSRAFATGDTAVYSAGTIELMSKTGAVLDSFTATEASGVAGFKVVSAGGHVLIETVPVPPGSFDQSSQGSDAGKLLGSVPSGSGEGTEHRPGHLDFALAAGMFNHS